MVNKNPFCVKCQEFVKEIMDKFEITDDEIFFQGTLYRCMGCKREVVWNFGEPYKKSKDRG